ncbi:MAG: hypothetical protein UU81_C0071G0001, partial [Microgenomates group bacterium GW2011_GWC1_41_8]
AQNLYTFNARPFIQTFQIHVFRRGSGILRMNVEISYKLHII